MGNTLYQYLAVFCANLGTLGYAISIGWMANVFILYDSDNSPLPSGRVQINELAWIGSMLGIGGLAGTVVIGWLTDRIGRKHSLIAMAVPLIVMTAFGMKCSSNFIISYMLIILAKNVYFLYGSRFFTGFCGGAMFVVIPLTVTEIAEDRVRGTLNTILVVATSGGTLIGLLAGHFIGYAAAPRIFLLFPVLFIVLCSFLPETPYYLMKVNRMEEAEQSLRFYRNVPPNNSEDKSFEHELSKLKQLQQQHQQQEKNAENAKAASLKIADFMNRPFSICCILMAAHEMNGAFTMISYTGVIFAKSGSALSPAVSSIIVGAIQLLGAYVSTLLVERLGRKLLMVFSFAGCALCQIVLATYMLLSSSTDVDVSAFKCIPIVSFSCCIFVAACGALPIPFVIIAEILPDKIRNLGITLCLCLSWGLTFVLVKVFPALLPIIGVHGCIFAFALFCFVTVIYLLVAVPETKGKSLEEILVLLKANKS